MVLDNVLSRSFCWLLGHLKGTFSEIWAGNHFPAEVSLEMDGPLLVHLSPLLASLITVKQS